MTIITIRRPLIIHIITTLTIIHIRTGLIIIPTIISITGLTADITDTDSVSINPGRCDVAISSSRTTRPAFNLPFS